MKMCYNVSVLSITFNSLVSFLFVVCSTILLSKNVFSQSVISPIRTAELENILLSDQVEESIHKRRSEVNPTAWFGPRSGRKKRSISLDDEILEILDEHGRDEDFQLSRNHPWAMFLSDPYAKRQFMKPRLGRANSWIDDEEKIIKAPPFSPRLGRRSLIPLKPRLGRAGSNQETAVFKPRLGRDPNFNNEFVEYADARGSIDDKDH